MKQVQPLLKCQGKNVSLPFFILLHLSNKFDGRNEFSRYILRLILKDLLEDDVFIEDFRNELIQMKDELKNMDLTIPSS